MRDNDAKPVMLWGADKTHKREPVGASLRLARCPQRTHRALADTVNIQTNHSNTAYIKACNTFTTPHIVWLQRESATDFWKGGVLL